MYCGKCGQELPHDTGFCDRCGNGFGAVPAQPTPTEESNLLILSASSKENCGNTSCGNSLFGDSASPIISVRTTPPGSGKNKVIIGTILAIVLTVGGFFYWENVIVQ